MLILFLSSSIIDVEGSNWDYLRIKYIYQYSYYDDFDDSLIQYNLTIENVLIDGKEISYDIYTDDPDPRSSSHHIQVIIDEDNGLQHYGIFDYNSILQFSAVFNLTLDLKELGHHYFNTFFIPINNPSFSFKEDYSTEYNFTFDTTFEIYNRTETGYFARLEYISSSIPTYNVKELAYTENGELLSHFYSHNTVFNSTFSYLWYNECILLAMSRTSAKTNRVSIIGLFSIQTIILVVVVIKRKYISSEKKVHTF